MKKYFKYILTFIFSSLAMISVTFAADDFEFCEKSGVVKVFQIVGYCLFILKIVVPIILIIMGCLDFGKAIISSDDKEIKNAGVMLAKRALAGVIVFFIPTIVVTAFNFVNGYGEVQNKNKSCTECLRKPDACKIPHDDGVFSS